MIAVPLCGRWAVAAITLFAGVPMGAQSRPSPEQQSRTLEQSRSTALHYAETLPDFICTERVERLSTANIANTNRPRAPLPVSSSDKLTIQVTYLGQKEHYKLVAIDGTPTDRTFESLEGLLSGGEFGSMLLRILDPATAADFQWKSWTTIAKRRAAVYSYRVDRANSRHTIGYRAANGELQTLIVGYRGDIVVDNETSGVLRILLEVYDIPPSFAVLKASTMVEYAFIDVGAGRYLLPAHAETKMSRPASDTRNVVSFVDYRKFAAETSIHFSDAETKKK